MREQRVPVSGTQKLVRAKRSFIAPVSPHEEITVTLTLRRKRDCKPRSSSLGRLPVHDRTHLSVAEAAAAFSPQAADLAAVRRFARAYGLRCGKPNLAGASVILRGPVEQFNRAFGVRLSHCREKKYASSYRGHNEEVTVPAELEGIITGVFGLDTHPAGRRPGRFAHGMRSEAIAPPPVTSKTRRPAEFADLYKFPTKALGKGQCIGLLEFAGGFRVKELNSYFAFVGMKAPNVVVREIPPGGNRPQGKRGTLNPDTEVYLDIEVAASLAPEAKIVIYFGDNTMQGWLNTLHASLMDKKNDPSVISISWGEAEQDWSPQAMRQIDELFQLAAHRGITICCSAGDRGVSECEDRLFTVAFPASSPHVLACGGTQLSVQRNGSRKETVWNQWKQFKMASGGGVSDVFPLPTYQQKAGVPLRRSKEAQQGRGIPDVAANASSATGYLIEADQTRMSLGGTSAAAPLWAALIARLNEAMGIRIGFLTPQLYTMDATSLGMLNDITQGFNGPSPSRAFHARPGWDPCTGLGSPDGEKLLHRLRARKAKGR